MSHFTVLVIGAKTEEEIREALYPFWELDLSRDELVEDPRAVFEPKFPVEELESEFQKCLVENADYLEEKKLHYEDAQEWIENWHGYYLNKEGTHYGYYHNPNAKWDWHQVGGRWAGYFRLREGEHGIKGEPSLLMSDEDKEKTLTEPLIADIVRKGDVDFEGMLLEKEAHAKESWKKYQEQLETGTNPYFEFGVKEGDTEESYVKRHTSFATFAVVKDGKWYEKGQMGWWGIVADEKDQSIWEEEFSKLLEDLPDDTLLALVDCHI